MDLTTIEFEQDNILLLCSDGLTNKVSDEMMKEELSNSHSLSEKVKALIQQANDNGGEDNISVVLIKMTTNHELGEESC